MGSGPSATEVSVLAEGEKPGPFAIRRHPACKAGVEQNPPDCKTMQKFTLNFFEKYANDLYIGQRDLIDPEKGKYGPEFKFITYKEAEKRCRKFGAGLFKLGYNVGKTLGVYAGNSAEWIHAIDASSLYGFAIVSLYDSLGPDALQYLLGHSQMEAVLVQQKNMDKLMKIVEQDKYNLKTIIVIGSLPEKKYNVDVEITTFAEICKLGEENPIDLPTIDPESPHFICYSSGTTGNPKGVIISHRASLSNSLAAADMINVGPRATHLSYLPLAHVFERAAVAVTAYYGGKIGFISGSVVNIQQDLQILRPTFMVAVPRVMNRFYDGLMNKMKNKPLIQAIFWGAWYAKKFCIAHYIPTGLFDKLVFHQLTDLMGGRVQQFVVGGAAMDPRIQEILQVATGQPVRTGYGLTEAGSGNICSPPDIHHVKMGSIGGPLKNVEVYIEPIDGYDDPNCGQIMIGGPCLSSGYLHDEGATRELFTEDKKWIKTGDVGKWDEDGYMIVVDRMRSIFKLSQGEYVAAEVLTQIYDAVPIVDQSFIYGNSQRSYLVAIIVPNKKEVSKFLGKERITDEEFENACNNNEDLKKFIVAELRKASDENKLFGYQRIVKVALEHDPWTIENEYQTPTFKLKRKKLEQRYKDVIEKLYAE